jgi:hypothetical protein
LSEAESKSIDRKRKNAEGSRKRRHVDRWNQ